MKIIPTGNALGAEITGIDLSKDISEADQKFITDAYFENCVVLFRGQSLSYDDLLRLREVFGPAGRTSSQLLGLGRRKYYPDEVPTDITIISNIIKEGGIPMGSLGDGEAFWHTDSSFTEVPISASLLHSKEVTDQGGETAFLNMYQAYDEMPDGLRARIEGKFANHSNVHTSIGKRRPEFDEVTDPSKSPGVKHPLVRIHPVTGKKCLFLGRRLNGYIFDMSLDESEELLDEIWAHACQDKYVWEHKWKVGDVVVWDNRCTMHHRNAFPSDARRLMHKSITAGEPVISGWSPAV
ncbi:MAG: TauD/TfdA family dioxygenase [Proteobacteria bacterium]|nr:TauD/TfdA family dioxygenase [Pseudomonadota bacterium]